jgi:hypothetical protein
MQNLARIGVMQISCEPGFLRHGILSAVENLNNRFPYGRSKRTHSEICLALRGLSAIETYAQVIRETQEPAGLSELRRIRTRALPVHQTVSANVLDGRTAGIRL